MDLREKAITLLASVLTDMTTVQQNDLFTVPAGKAGVIVRVVVRNPTASLARAAGASSYNFGVTANCDTWLQTVDLNDITDTDHFKLIESPDTVYAVAAAAEVFGIKVITPGDLAADAYVDVFGYLY